MEFQENFRNQAYTFSTWNVQGLTEKKRETFAEIERESEDLVVLTETKLRGTGQEESGNYIHIFSGVQAGHARAGVSIFMKKELGIVKWSAVSERIITAKLNIHGHKIVIIGVYWVDDSATPAVKDKFQDNLKNAIKSIKSKRELIILGDFNSKVGTSTTSKVVGNFGDKEVNNNGRRLVNLCEECNLKIQNTFFNHDDIHKYTWYHKRNSSKSLIDYCITRQESTLIVHDVLACRWLECGTDHVFLEATISFPYPNSNEQGEAVTDEDVLEMRKYRTYMLFSKTVRASYKDYLESTITLSPERNTQEIYQHLKDSVHSAALNILGVQEKNVFGVMLWDKELKGLRAKRLGIWEECEAAEVLSKKAAFDSHFDEIKNEVWEGICSAINNANRCKKRELVWTLFNDVLNQTNENAVQQQSSAEFYKTLLKESRIGVKDFQVKNDESIGNFYKIGPDKFIQISIEDVTEALVELEDGGWPTPGGLSIQLLRCSNHKTKLLLTSLIQDIFEGKKIPPEINETFVTDIVKVKNRDKYVVGDRMHSHSIMRVMGVILRKILEKTVPYKNSCKILLQQTYLETTFTLRLLLQKSAEKQNASFHFAFIDFKNSYFDVVHEKLFRVLKRYGICKDLLGIIEHLHKLNTVRITTSERLSEAFTLSKGLMEGCSLARTLFKMYILESIKKWSKDNIYNGVTIENRILHYIFSNDKLIIVAGNPNALEKMVSNLQRRFKLIGLHLSSKSVSYLGDEKLTLGRAVIPGKSAINFEDSLLGLDGRNVEDVCNRILEAKKAVGFLHPVVRDENITKKNKRRIFSSFIRCILTNGCETWTLTEDLKKALNTAEMGYWKWFYNEYPVRYSAEEMRSMVGIKYNVFNIMMLRKTAWYTKVKQMSSDRWPRRVLDWDPKGTAKIGKPRKKWVDGLEEFLSDLSHYHSFMQKSKLLCHKIEPDEDESENLHLE